MARLATVEGDIERSDIERSDITLDNTNTVHIKDTDGNFVKTKYRIENGNIVYPSTFFNRDIALSGNSGNDEDSLILRGELLEDTELGCLRFHRYPNSNDTLSGEEDLLPTGFLLAGDKVFFDWENEELNGENESYLTEILTGSFEPDELGKGFKFKIPNLFKKKKKGFAGKISQPGGGIFGKSIGKMSGKVFNKMPAVQFMKFQGKMFKGLAKGLGKGFKGLGKGLGKAFKKPGGKGGGASDMMEQYQQMQEQKAQEEQPIQEEIPQEEQPIQEEIPQEEQPIQEEIPQEEQPIQEEIPQEEQPNQKEQPGMVELEGNEYLELFGFDIDELGEGGFGSLIGSIAGSVIAPGVGTAAGGAIGSILDMGMNKPKKAKPNLLAMFQNFQSITKNKAQNIPLNSKQPQPTRQAVAVQKKPVKQVTLRTSSNSQPVAYQNPQAPSKKPSFGIWEKHKTKIIIAGVSSAIGIPVIIYILKKIQGKKDDGKT